MREKELIEKTLKGDEGAFAALVEQNREAVFRHILSLIHQVETAEDLTQETFLQAYRHLGDFKMRSAFSTWVWRIAHNLSLSYLKKHRLYEQEFREEFLLPQGPTPDSGFDEERLSRVRAAMESLSPKHRVVFEMYDLKHIPQKQIAAELGIALGTVRSRLYYARLKIREFLREA